MLRFLFIFIFLSGFLKAQNEFGIHQLELAKTNSYFFLDKVLSGSNETENYLKERFPYLNRENSTLKLLHEIESPGGKHLLYQQFIYGRAVINATIKINTSIEGKIIALFDNSIDYQVQPTSIFPSASVLDAFAAQKDLNPQEMIKWKVEEVYLPFDGELIPCLSLEVLNDDIAFTAYLNTNGLELFRENHVQSFTNFGKDSLVNALVFLPDPLTSANKSYAAPYLDYKDSNSVVLNNEMVNVQVSVDFENGIFSLEGPYVKITNYKKPTYTPATSTTPFFTFNRAEQEFEDINTYFHITSFQEYIQSLGFMNLANYQIHAETHAYDGDNSTFVSTHNPPRLNFGEGGVDDAEDADVIVHEYGHAVQRDAAPGTLIGFERKSLDEGNSDYLAASYSRAINDFNWQAVFPWDGHNEFYPGRSAASSKHYPEDFQFASYHDNAEIWASALMEIWTAIGQQATDEIVLQSFYSYASNMTMSEAAMLVIASDSLLFNGLHYNDICTAFNNRGFSTICNGFTGTNDLTKSQGNADFEIYNSDQFSKGGSAQIHLKKKDFSGSWTLNNAEGRLMSSGQILPTDKMIEINGEALRPGFYLFSILSEDTNITTFKLIRIN